MSHRDEPDRNHEVELCLTSDMSGGGMRINLEGSWDDWTLEDVEVAIKSNDVGVRAAAARSTLIDASGLRTLMNDSHDWVRRTAAENPELSIQDLVATARSSTEKGEQQSSGDPELWSVVLRRALDETEAHFRSEALDSLMTAAPRFRRMLINHAEAGNRLLDLAEDRMPSMRANVAEVIKNPEVLNCLSVDRAPQVHLRVARNSATSSEALRRLSTSKKIETRIAVAAHAATEQEILIRLLGDRSSRVKSTAISALLSRSEDPSHLVDHQDPRVREVAAMATTAISLLRALSADKDPRVRRAVAVRPEIEMDILEALVYDDSKQVRTTAAKAFVRRIGVSNAARHEVLEVREAATGAVLDALL